jgi:Fe-S oxidoreductase
VLPRANDGRPYQSGEHHRPELWREAEQRELAIMIGVPSPSESTYWLVTGRVLFLIIPFLGLGLFTYIVSRRLVPLLQAAPDLRLNHPAARLKRVLKFWLGQWKQPRYAVAGALHIIIFAGFLILAIRSLSLIMLGVSDRFVMPGFSGTLGRIYNVIKDYTATLVFLAVAMGAVRRGIFKPARYAVPAKYGKDHTAEALFVLGLIGTLMLSESLFEGSQAVLQAHQGHGAGALFPLTLAWVFKQALTSVPASVLASLHLGAYLAHELTFFAFLCFLPLGKHFHVITALFNIYFAKLDRGLLKPVRWDIPENQLDQVKSFGVKTFTDFTWKHMLDFYSCADCGRCSDNCPANAVGRPLSPRFITIKGREHSFRHYPLFGEGGNGEPLIGGIYSEDEVWSCTTCGACEEECPLLVEYIDKIVDLRRGMVDEGNVPQSLQKPLKALESRGNPYGKPDKKRADWTKAPGFQQACRVKTLNGSESGHAETLYFVDSITSYDDRIQSIGRATARILDHVGENFGILGAAEKDSGHEVRRFGEETLFMALRDQNVDAIKSSGATRIVTADPHAYNALKHDYHDVPPVEHISQVIAREVKKGKIALKAVENTKDVYTYHDPCYLGRHNQVYDDPRDVLDAIPGLQRVEMSRCRDRSFCCGGGGLMLFYEPKEDQRMGVKRVQMAAEAGANVIVTACPFCMVNIEDAIKVAGLEGKMAAIDLAELVDRQIARPEPEEAGVEPAAVR